MKFPSMKTTKITDSEFEHSLENIKKSGFSMPLYSTNLKEGTASIITGAHAGEDLRRSYLSECKIIEADFRNAVFADSKCCNTKFDNVRFHHTNVEYCNFNNCEFINNKFSIPYIGTNFSFSNFTNCELTGIEIANSTLDSVSFVDTIFQDARIYMSTVENSSFSNCTFCNVELNELNLCFSDFDNVHMDHVSLPFYQLPYVFGGIKYFLNNSDNVFIGAEEPGGKVLYSEQYRQLLPDIVNFFEYYNEYFPIANIYIACDESSLAYETIVLGIQQAAKQKDFRMLKFLCKLAADSHIFPSIQLQSLYDQIYNAANFDVLTDFERKNYFINLGIIRELLLFNDSQKTTLEYRFQTNIDSTDAGRLGILIAEIESIFSVFDSQDITYRIEMKHQCPWDIIYVIITSMPIIQLLIQSFSTLLGPANSVMTFANNCISLGKTFRDSPYQKMNYDQEIKRQQLELLKQEAILNQQRQQINCQEKYMNDLKIRQLEQSLIQSNQILYANGITATTSYHIK